MSANEQSAAAAPAAAPTDPLALRQRALTRLPAAAALTPESIAGLAPEAARHLLHELQVHQIELEMQNEALHESEVDLERMRARYFDLYDLAPAGYCTLSEHSLIMQANLSAAGILGFAQLMESATPPPTPREQGNLEQIIKAGWHLLELINEILDLAAIESGRVSLSMEAIVLEDVLGECGSIVAAQASLHGIEVSIAGPGDRLAIAADRSRLKQVIINLVSNAIKYNRPGGTVSVTCAPGSDNCLRISVRDTGLGMAPGQLAQLFQSFNRLGQQLGPVQGSGIGLVVTKQLVELMGGQHRRAKQRRARQCVLG